MKIAMFYHSLLSDWNHGNAHFLRGVVTELLRDGHEVTVYEPRDGWSMKNLTAEHGRSHINGFRQTYPGLDSVRYDPDALNLSRTLRGVDLVIVHEWNDHDLVAAVGEHRRRIGGYRLLFHDTHHRSVTDPASMAAYDLSAYDGVLAFGEVIRELYLKRGWADAAWTWHEAADVNVFYPTPAPQIEGDLIWVGNWGDDERVAELDEFLLEPVRSLHLKAHVHGVRYPERALDALAGAGITYGGWLANYRVPGVFGRYRVTVHIPRQPYAEALPGIPTIRVFEALACGIPLVSAPWSDAEHLFEPGRDFLIAQDGEEMTAYLEWLLSHPDEAEEIAHHGRRTILDRHTCAHRVDQLMRICRELGLTIEDDRSADEPERGITTHA